MNSTRQKTKGKDLPDVLRPQITTNYYPSSESSNFTSAHAAQHDVQPYQNCYEAVKDDSKYEMDHPFRGYAIIINNQKFDKPEELQYREGSEVDRDSLVQVCRHLGFEDNDIIVRDNQTVEEMKQLVKDYTDDRSTNADCFMMFILTHGASGGRVYGRDYAVAVPDLLRSLKNDKNCLIGKPKLVFVQACRGEESDKGWQIYTDEQGQGNRQAKRYKISRESDFFIGYSTVDSYYSFRNPQKGSWFVQAIRDVFTHKDSRNLEITALMSRVSRAVSYQQESNCETPELTGLKQSPFYTSTLTKELYFRPHTF